MYRFQRAIIYGITPVIEEGSKFFAHIFGFLKEYLAIFNSTEFILYLKRIMTDEIKIETCANSGRILLKAAKEKLGMNDQDINKILNNEETINQLATLFQTMLQKQYGTQNIKVQPSAVKKLLVAVELQRKYKNKNIRLIKIVGRLMTVLMHIVASFLQSRNRTLAALILHSVYNMIAILVMDFIVHKRISS
jgi:hypothetical protein